MNSATKLVNRLFSIDEFCDKTRESFVFFPFGLFFLPRLPFGVFNLAKLFNSSRLIQRSP